MSASRSWKQVALLNGVTIVGLAKKLRFEKSIEGGEPSRY